MKNLFAYLSGSIKKQHNSHKGSSFWTDADMQQMQRLFAAENINIIFLNPASRSDDLSDPKSIFGRDLLQVCASNCVFVDDRERRGVGVGYEMAVANSKGIPVFSWVPHASCYFPKETKLVGQKLYDWKHPFFMAPSIAIYLLPISLKVCMPT